MLVALVWGAVARWLTEYERYAEATAAHARLLAAEDEPASVRHPQMSDAAPRSLFGLSFESRPPPVLA